MKVKELLKEAISSLKRDIAHDAQVIQLNDTFDSRSRDIYRLADKLDELQKLIESIEKNNKDLKGAVEHNIKINESLKLELQNILEKDKIQTPKLQEVRKRLKLFLGGCFGAVLGIYVHKAALLIAYKIDNLEECDIEEKRNGIMKLLTNDMFKPLLLLSACLGAYGSTLV